MRRSFYLLLILCLPACATIIDGTSQSVSVITDPPGANCSVDRTSTRLGQISPTPGSVHIHKSDEEISIVCMKDGYQTVTIGQRPKFKYTTVGNAFLGGAVGVLVDFSTGANYAYPDNINITMTPTAPPSIPQVNPALIQPVSLPSRTGS